MRGENDHIAGNQRDLLVDICSHARESRHRLTLASRRDKDQLLRRIILHIIDGNNRSCRIIHITERNGRPDDLHHRPAFQNDLPAELCRTVDDLLYAIDVGRKRRNDQARFCMLCKYLIKFHAHRTFRHRKSRMLRIGGVAHKGKDPLPSDLREPLKIDRIAEDRRIIDLEISCVEEHTRRGVQCECCGILDRVIGLDKFDLDVTERHDITEIHDVPADDVQHLVLLELVLDQGHRELCRINGHIDLAEHIRDRPDVVLMTMCDHKSLYLAVVLFQIKCIRKHKINTQHVIFREGHTAVNDDDGIPVLDRGNVHSDLLQTAERNDLYTLYLIVFILQKILLFFLY